MRRKKKGFVIKLKKKKEPRIVIKKVYVNKPSPKKKIIRRSTIIFDKGEV